MGKRASERAATAAAADSGQAKAASVEPDNVPKGGTAKFKKGSKVLVPHTDQYYAAVVMQGQKRPEGQFYLLHYEGWSHKYDEWVEEAGVVRYDRALLEQSAAAAGNQPGDLTGRRRRADIAPAEPQLAVEIPQQLRLHIPPLLKKVVLDDSTQINLHGRLLPLPRSAHGRPSVADILKEYQEQVGKEAALAEAPDLQVQEAAAEMVRGVSQYFDQGLHHFLLYPHELHQAEELLGAIRPPTPAVPPVGGDVGDSAASNTTKAHPLPSQCYGAEHLVRLFVKLPELVPVAYMTPPDVVRMEQQLHDLMARMTQVKLQARYFSLPEEYQPNPHFNPLQALTLQALLGTSTPAVGGGGADSPAPGTGGKGAAGRTVTGPNSEADG